MATVSLALDTPALAETYERVSAERQFSAGQRLIEELGVSSGEKVLDIGSGTGLVAQYVADLVGPDGAVIGIDPLPFRIALAEHKSRPNLKFQVGNAYDLSGFPAESFDVVYLNAVFHWLPEKLEPLRQIHRVLKRGGRLGISTGSKEHPHQLQAIKQQILAREPYRSYLKDSVEASRRVSVDELRHLFSQTGFGVKKIDLLPFVRTDQTPDAAIIFSEASSFGNFLGHLPQDLRASAREEIKRELEQRLTPEGITGNGARIIAVAVRL
jgi:arsenite methyltransferase